MYGRDDELEDEKPKVTPHPNGKRFLAKNQFLSMIFLNLFSDLVWSENCGSNCFVRPSIRPSDILFLIAYIFRFEFQLPNETFSKERPQPVPAEHVVEAAHGGTHHHPATQTQAHETGTGTHECTTP